MNSSLNRKYAIVGNMHVKRFLPIGMIQFLNIMIFSLFLKQKGSSGVFQTSMKKRFCKNSLTTKNR